MVFIINKPESVSEITLNILFSIVRWKRVSWAPESELTCEKRLWQQIKKERQQLNNLPVKELAEECNYRMNGQSSCLSLSCWWDLWERKWGSAAGRTEVRMRRMWWERWRNKADLMIFSGASHNLFSSVSHCDVKYSLSLFETKCTSHFLYSFLFFMGWGVLISPTFAFLPQDCSNASSMVVTKIKTDVFQWFTHRHTG